MRALAILILIGFALFGALQFVRPQLENPPVVADFQAPPEVKAILTTSCYNCHSNETKLPWFDKIVPAYWLVVRDVNRGRAHLNFSNFENLPAAQKTAFLYNSVDQIEQGFMPPGNYLLVHPEAKISKEQIATLRHYLHPNDDIKTAPPEAAAATDAQRQQWIAAGAKPAENVEPESNGIAFHPDYASWKPVSFTDRFDGATMRTILGNDVAQQAIASGNIHPWPDGTVFAKIAHKQQADASGTVSTGQFAVVEFMAKDKVKYKDTAGWGFSRWLGADHKPWSKDDASFGQECVACHRPMQDRDFVFTMPLHDGPDGLWNPGAALPANFPVPIRDWNVITTQYDHPRHMMSALYGNPAAVARSRTAPQAPLTRDAQLAFVTWSEKDDQHWFGARIPSAVQTIEVVRGNATSGPDYQDYSGTPLVAQTSQTTPEGTAAAQQRIAAITSLLPAAMP